MNCSESLVEIIQSHARYLGSKTAFAFLTQRGQIQNSLSYANLHELASLKASQIAQMGPPGSHVAVFSRSNIQGFIIDLIGCLYAKCVAVPLHAPKQSTSLDGLVATLQEVSVAAVLSEELPEELEKLLQSVVSENSQQARLDPELALIQYTSGSTYRPKGVCISHQNIIANQRMIQEAFGHGENEIVVSWLPLFHDMGLIGNVFQPLFLGATAVLMSPMAFLMRPMVWLKAISDFGCTTSGGPDFAYRHCLDRLDGIDIGALDLSKWRVAFNGSENVREETMNAFSRKFAAVGFSKSAFLPCYGLAEATLLITGGGHGRTCGGYVSCGKPYGGTRLRVIDPVTRQAVNDNQVGEIWVQGPAVSSGYWQRDDLDTFAGKTLDGDGPYLRTGDLGFVDGGEVFVTGRLKDLWIISGRNIYPTDIEYSVEKGIGRVRCGRVGAIMPYDNKIVVVCELNDRRISESEAASICGDIVEIVSEELSLRVDDVILLRKGGLPVTTSGKFQRGLCREKYIAGHLDNLRIEV